MQQEGLTEEEKERKRRRKKRENKKWALTLILIACFAVVVSFYAAKGNYYYDHFFENTSFNGIKVGPVTAEEAKEIVQKETSKYQLTISGRGRSETITADDIGLTYVDNGDIDACLDKQNTMMWLPENQKEHDYTLQIESKVNDNKKKKVIDELLCFTGDFVKGPEDATMKKNKKGLYVVEPEKQGCLLDEEKAKKRISEAIDKRETEVDLEEFYIKPKILSDDKTLNHTIDSYNKYLKAKIVFKFGENKEIITGEDLEPYIYKSGDEYLINTDWVSDVVNKWASKYESFGKERVFKTHNGDEIIVPAGGDYGWAMDREKTAKRLRKHVEKGDRGSYKAAWIYKAMGWSNNDLTGTYVEVSIDEQMLYLYKDGECILETPVVTGKSTPDRETIRGCYAIDAKKSPAVLGSLDVQGYESPVDYWCPFNGGQGLHDAPWRDSFGGDIYIYNGSHGCVNIPTSAMATIYNTVEIGTAVVVY